MPSSHKHISLETFVPEMNIETTAVSSAVTEVPTTSNFQQPPTGKNHSKQDLHINFKIMFYLLHLKIFSLEIKVLKTEIATTVVLSTATEAKTT